MFSRCTTEERISIDDWPEEDGAGGADAADEDEFREMECPSSVVKVAKSSSPFQRQRRPSLGGESGTTASSSLTDPSSSGSGGNVWTRLLGKDTNWDNLEGDPWDDVQQDEGGRECHRVARTCTLTLWYEARHFLSTVWSNPLILLTSLLTFGVLCGIGMALINAESEAHIQKQKSVAEFVVSLYFFLFDLLDLLLLSTDEVGLFVLVFESPVTSFVHAASRTVSLSLSPSLSLPTLFCIFASGEGDGTVVLRRIPTCHAPTLLHPAGGHTLGLLRLPPYTHRPLS
jgi:hypothetical protein